MEPINLKYSSQARALLNSLKDNSFDINEFEDWVKKAKFIVGGGYLIEFLELKSKEEV